MEWFNYLLYFKEKKAPVILFIITINYFFSNIIIIY